MSKYRYVGGSKAEIMDTKYAFTSFGQLVEMDDELAEHAIANRVHLIPADAFEGENIPADQLKKYARFETHSVAPADFIAKRNSMWVKAQVHRDSVLEARKGNPLTEHPVSDGDQHPEPESSVVEDN